MAHGSAHIDDSPWRTQIVVGGHSITADEPVALGRQGAGPAPYDLLLASLLACTAITLKMYAARKQWPLVSLDVYAASRLPAKIGKSSGHCASPALMTSSGRGLSTSPNAHQ